MKNMIVEHYDALIDENNDPVYDPEPLKAYMDRWDGPEFIKEMQLEGNQSVLEIGVGTGRLAVRVAPRCKAFVGIDLSPKTVERARENLKDYANVEILCADWMDYRPGQTFDVIYSSLTFLHIRDKQRAIAKVPTLLKKGGRFVLSIDKNPSDTLDYGTRTIRLFPDRQETVVKHLAQAGMKMLKQYETECAFVFVSSW